MGVRIHNTQWVFMLTSAENPEDRHLNDIVFGIKVLIKKEVPISNISLIIDGNRSDIIQKMAPLIDNTKRIYCYSELEELILSIEKENIIFCVTGHGSINGIDSDPPIKPYDFLHTLRIKSNAKRVFLLLGQCYAGIFSYLRVTHCNRKNGKKTPQTVIIGATKISESISISYSFESVAWLANIMFLAFFSWLNIPQDIDGDGKYSFMDAFKYITYIINTTCYTLEKKQYIETVRLTHQYKEILEQFQSIPISEMSLDKQIEKHSIEKRLEEHIIHQEPWIVNTNIALNTDLLL